MGPARTPKKTTPRRRHTRPRLAINNLPLLKNPLPEDQAAAQYLRKFPRSVWRKTVLPSHLRTYVVPMFSGGPWDVVWTFTYPDRLAPNHQTAIEDVRWLSGLVKVLIKRTMLAFLEWTPTEWMFHVFLSLPHRQPQAKRFLAEVRGAARADGVVITRRRYSAKRGMGYYLSPIRYFCTPFLSYRASSPSQGFERARTWQSSPPSPGSARGKDKQR